MKPKTKTILFILLSFLLGILCGWFLEDRLSDKTHSKKEREHVQFIEVLSQRLSLSEMQIAQVDSILESRKQKMETCIKDVIAIRDSTRMEIRKVLNDEQARIFDEFNEKKDREEKKKWEKEEKKSK
ncbi:MAG: hypothetical protein JXA06_04695 [Bacteroidetes bacterium]|nr:hypothetical protein [Bacteroidota bacterium]